MNNREYESATGRQGALSGREEDVKPAEDPLLGGCVTALVKRTSSLTEMTLSQVGIEVSGRLLTVSSRRGTVFRGKMGKLSFFSAHLSHARPRNHWRNNAKKWSASQTVILLSIRVAFGGRGESRN